MHCRWEFLWKFGSSQTLLAFTNSYSLDFLLVLTESISICFTNILLILSQQVLPVKTTFHATWVLSWSDTKHLTWISQMSTTAAFCSQMVSAYSPAMTAAPMINDRSLQTRQSCKGQWISRNNLLRYLQIEQLFTMSSVAFTEQKWIWDPLAFPGHADVLIYFHLSSLL